MRIMFRIAIVCLLAMSFNASIARADDETGIAGWVLYYTAAIAVWGGAATSFIVNTVQIAQWDGSYLWGGIGIATGALVPIWQHASVGDMTVGYIVGGSVAAVGIFSLVLAATRQDEPREVSRLQLEPILLQNPGAPLEPGVAISYRF
jgi:hypothetical protein